MQDLSEKCNTCRYGPIIDEEAGRSCDNCEGYDHWREPKRVDEEKCNTCIFENDPCHYRCVDCQDSRNWEPKPTLKQILKDKVREHQEEIKRLEALMKQNNFTK